MKKSVGNFLKFSALLGFLTCAFYSTAFAAKTTSVSANASTDELSAKAFLEDLMVRRYSQGLGTIVDRQAFSLGVQLQLMDASKGKPKVKNDPNETPSDLLLGALDPEKLIQQFGMDEEKPAFMGFLATKKIKTVQVYVGLREDLGSAIKTDVEKWLNTRLTNEFGKIGKSEVNFVKEIPAKPEKIGHREWWDWLSQFQHLAGELLMAMTLLLGIILWRFTTSKSSVDRNNNGESPNIKLQAQGMGGGSGEDGAKKPSIEELEARSRSAEEIISLSVKLNALVPKISSEFENIVRSWCQAGEEGKLKLVCFAEAVGRDVGRLPIPVDAMKDLSRIFAKMNEVNPKEKAQILEKVYWDLVSVLNLGPDVLSQPFGYLAGLDTSVISNVLMDQNSKMKTLVSLFMPDDIRRKFVKPMTADQKFQLLEAASKMNEIASDELRTADHSLMKKLKAGESSGDSVHLEMTLEKIISSLSILEEIEMLAKLEGPGVLEYKRKIPSLAFLKDWPEDKLSIIMGRIRVDQAVVYLRLQPEMKDRMIALAPPITAEMLNDELAEPDKLNDEEKIRRLEVFAELLKEMVKHKEVDLAELFPEPSKNKENNVVEIKSA